MCERVNGCLVYLSRSDFGFHKGRGNTKKTLSEFKHSVNFSACIESLSKFNSFCCAAIFLFFLFLLNFRLAFEKTNKQKLEAISSV